MVKLVKGAAGKPKETNARTAQPADEKLGWWSEQFEAREPLLDAAWRARRRVAEGLEEDETLALIDLRRELPRELWLELLHHAMMSFYTDVPAFEGERRELDEELRSFDEVGLRLEFHWVGDGEADEDDEDGWFGVVSVFAGEKLLGANGYDDFFESWQDIATDWLIHALGITPSLIRATLKRELPDYFDRNAPH